MVRISNNLVKLEIIFKVEDDWSIRQIALNYVQYRQKFRIVYYLIYFDLIQFYYNYIK
jgi:hypothetical protein